MKELFSTLLTDKVNPKQVSRINRFAPIIALMTSTDSEFKAFDLPIDHEVAPNKTAFSLEATGPAPRTVETSNSEALGLVEALLTLPLEDFNFEAVPLEGGDFDIRNITIDGCLISDPDKKIANTIKKNLKKMGHVPPPIPPGYGKN